MCGEAAWALRASRLSHFSTATKVSGPSLVWIAPAPSASIAGAYSMQPASAWTAGMLARNAARMVSRWPGLAVMMAKTWIMGAAPGSATKDEPPLYRSWVPLGPPVVPATALFEENWAWLGLLHFCQRPLSAITEP